MRAAYFRRTQADLKKPKNLWDQSRALYPHARGVRNEVSLEWHFPSGAWTKFGHLQHDSDVYDHQGAEYPLICFDEATHFSNTQFWYLLSRNRAPVELGVRPYVRMTCNPDPDSFLADMVTWWIDEEGFAIRERSGVIRWFIRDEDTDELHWGGSPNELREKYAKQFKRRPNLRPKSFTFIPALLDDNPSLGDDYRADLEQQPLVERMRLIHGNWRVRPVAGTFWKDAWIIDVDDMAPKTARRVRYWDLAGSKRKRADFTAGVRSALHVDEGDELFTIEHVVNAKLTHGEVKANIASCAIDDGPEVEIWVEEEKGAAGQILVNELRDWLQKTIPNGSLYTVLPSPVGNQDKRVRAKPVGAFAELSARAGKPAFRLVRSVNSKATRFQLLSFPEGANDDVVDGVVGGWHALHTAPFSYASASW